VAIGVRAPCRCAGRRRPRPSQAHRARHRRSVCRPSASTVGGGAAVCPGQPGPLCPRRV